MPLLSLSTGKDKSGIGLTHVGIICKCFQGIHGNQTSTNRELVYKYTLEDVVTANAIYHNTTITMVVYVVGKC